MTTPGAGDPAPGHHDEEDEMRAKFIGHDKSDPEAVTLGGVTYPKGKAVEVPAAWEAKIRGNSHFEVVKGRPPKQDKADDENGA